MNLLVFYLGVIVGGLLMALCASAKRGGIPTYPLTSARRSSPASFPPGHWVGIGAVRVDVRRARPAGVDEGPFVQGGLAYLHRGELVLPSRVAKAVPTQAAGVLVVSAQPVLRARAVMLRPLPIITREILDGIERQNRQQAQRLRMRRRLAFWGAVSRAVLAWLVVAAGLSLLAGAAMGWQAVRLVLLLAGSVVVLAGITIMGAPRG